MARHLFTMHVTQRDLDGNERLKRLVEQAMDRDRDSGKVSDVEYDTKNGATREDAAQESLAQVDAPCTINVMSVRKKLADPDNVCTKYFVDGIVKSGILQDDSPEFVTSVTVNQRKAQKGEEEKTIITIEW